MPMWSPPPHQDIMPSITPIKARPSSTAATRGRAAMALPRWVRSCEWLSGMRMLGRPSGVILSNRRRTRSVRPSAGSRPGERAAGAGGGGGGGGGVFFLPGARDHPPPLGEPADGAGNREQDGEHLDREAHRLVHDAGVEVDVGVELVLDEVVVLKGDALEFEGDVQQGIAPGYLEHLIGGPLDDRGAGVVVLVDAVTKTHEAAFAGLDPLDELRDALAVSDLGEHAEDGLVGATMEGSVEGSGGGGGGGEGVRP